MTTNDITSSPAAFPRRHRSAFFIDPQPPDEERQEWDGDALQAARERHIARREWALTHGDTPLPAVDGDGHVIPTPAMLARQAADEAEAEAAYIADLTPARLDVMQLRRWHEWLAAYELHRPEFLRLSLGLRAEMLARQQLAPWTFEDEDPRHPHGGYVLVVGVSARLAPPIAERPRAFPNERILNAVREQLLTATWLPSESRKPMPPTPPTFDERIAAAHAEREARRAARARPDHNWRLIVEGGRGW